MGDHPRGQLLIVAACILVVVHARLCLCDELRFGLLQSHTASAVEQNSLSVPLAAVHAQQLARVDAVRSTDQLAS